MKFWIAALPAGFTMKSPAALIATGFGSGRFYPAPGTWGTLAAWILALLMGKIALVIAVIAACVAGWWAVEKFEAASGDHDSGMVVIDEWAGMWLALLFAAPVWDQLVLAFVLFRVLDIWKPWPIKWIDENMDGPPGVIADDLLAGLLAGICVFGYGAWIP